MYVKYCWYSGLSNPHLASYAATISGSFMAVWLRLAATGSLGTRCEIRNTHLGNPEQHYHHQEQESDNKTKQKGTPFLRHR